MLQTPDGRATGEDPTDEGSTGEEGLVTRIPVSVLDGSVRSDLVVSADTPLRDLLAAVLGVAPRTDTPIRLVRVDGVVLGLDATAGEARIRPGEVLVVAQPVRPVASPRRAERGRPVPPERVSGCLVARVSSAPRRLIRHAVTHPRARAGALGLLALAAVVLVGIAGAQVPRVWQAALVAMSLAPALARVAPALALATYPVGGLDDSPAPGDGARLVRVVRARQRGLVVTATTMALAGTGVLSAALLTGPVENAGRVSAVLAVSGLGLALVSTEHRQRPDRTMLVVAATAAGTAAALTRSLTDPVALGAVLAGLLTLATVLALPAGRLGVETALRLGRLVGIARAGVLTASLPLAMWALGVVEALRAGGSR